jgi:hypothetical protein
MGTMSTFDRYVHVVSHVEHDTVTSQMDVTHLATFSDADEASDYAVECSARIEKLSRARRKLDRRARRGGEQVHGGDDLRAREGAVSRRVHLSNPISSLTTPSVSWTF